jgi:hypothetical protein
MGKENFVISAEKKIYRDQLITLGDLEQFKTDLLNELARILQQPQQAQTKSWLKSSEVRKLLCISPGTLQNLRVNGTLPFSKIGSIVYYKQEDILKLLEGSKSK